MIVLKRPNGERQVVASLAGIDMTVWTQTADAVPADMEKRAYKFGDTGAVPLADDIQVTPIEFLRLLTAAELDAVLASDNPQLKKAVLFIQASPKMKLDGPDVVQGLKLMKQLGILTGPRALRIAAGLQPE